MAEPLIVRPKEAFRMLGIGKTLGFAMLRDGRLEKIQISGARGRAVGITIASIEKLIREGAVKIRETGIAVRPKFKRGN